MGTHDRMAQVALSLIAKHGRPLKIARLSRDADDVAMPWRGPDSDLDECIDVVGVFVDFADTQSDVPRIRGADQRVLVAALATGEDLSDFDKVIDSKDGAVYSIHRCRVVEPGTTRILYDIELKA